MKEVKEIKESVESEGKKKLSWLLTQDPRVLGAAQPGAVAVSPC